MVEAEQQLARAVKLAVDLIWLQYDTNQSGELEFEQARAFLVEVLKSIDENLQMDNKKFVKLFGQYDRTAKGTLSKEEMTEMVSQIVDDAQFEQRLSQNIRTSQIGRRLVGKKKKKKSLDESQESKVIRRTVTTEEYIKSADKKSKKGIKKTKKRTEHSVSDIAPQTTDSKRQRLTLQTRSLSKSDVKTTSLNRAKTTKMNTINQSHSKTPTRKNIGQLTQQIGQVESKKIRASERSVDLKKSQKSPSVVNKKKSKQIRSIQSASQSAGKSRRSRQARQNQAKSPNMGPNSYSDASSQTGRYDHSESQNRVSQRSTSQENNLRRFATQIESKINKLPQLEISRLSEQERQRNIFKFRDSVQTADANQISQEIAQNTSQSRQNFNYNFNVPQEDSKNSNTENDQLIDSNAQSRDSNNERQNTNPKRRSSLIMSKSVTAHEANYTAPPQIIRGHQRLIPNQQEENKSDLILNTVKNFTFANEIKPIPIMIKQVAPVNLGTQSKNVFKGSTQADKNQNQLTDSPQFKSDPEQNNHSQSQVNAESTANNILNIQTPSSSVLIDQKPPQKKKSHAKLLSKSQKEMSQVVRKKDKAKQLKKQLSKVTSKTSKPISKAPIVESYYSDEEMQDDSVDMVTEKIKAEYNMQELLSDAYEGGLEEGQPMATTSEEKSAFGLDALEIVTMPEELERGTIQYVLGEGRQTVQLPTYKQKQGLRFSLDRPDGSEMHDFIWIQGKQIVIDVPSEQQTGVYDFNLLTEDQVSGAKYLANFSVKIVQKEQFQEFQFPQIDFNDPIRCQTNIQDPIKISLPSTDSISYWLATGSQQFATCYNGILYIQPKEEKDSGSWDIKLHAQNDKKELHVYTFKVIVDHQQTVETVEAKSQVSQDHLHMSKSVSTPQSENKLDDRPLQDEKDQEQDELEQVFSVDQNGSSRLLNEYLPNSEQIRKATYGDDSEITDEALETVREIYEYDTDVQQLQNGKKRSSNSSPTQKNIWSEEKRSITSDQKVLQRQLSNLKPKVIELSRSSSPSKSLTRTSLSPPTKGQSISRFTITNKDKKQGPLMQNLSKSKFSAQTKADGIPKNILDAQKINLLSYSPKKQYYESNQDAQDQMGKLKLVQMQQENQLLKAEIAKGKQFLEPVSLTINKNNNSPSNHSVSSAKKAHCKLNVKLGENLDQTKSRVEMLKQKLSALRKEKVNVIEDNYKKNQDRLTNEQTNLTCRLRETQQSSQAMDHELHCLYTQQANQRVQVEQHVVKLTDVRQAESTLRKELSFAQNQLNQCIDQNRSMQSDLQGRYNEIQKQLETSDQLKHEIKGLERAFIDQNVVYQTSSQTISELVRNQNDFASNISMQEQRAEQMRVELSGILQENRRKETYLQNEYHNLISIQQQQKTAEEQQQTQQRLLQAQQALKQAQEFNSQKYLQSLKLELLQQQQQALMYQNPQVLQQSPLKCVNIARNLEVPGTQVQISGNQVQVSAPMDLVVTPQKHEPIQEHLFASTQKNLKQDQDIDQIFSTTYKQFADGERFTGKREGEQGGLTSNMSSTLPVVPRTPTKERHTNMDFDRSGGFTRQNQSEPQQLNPVRSVRHLTPSRERLVNEGGQMRNIMRHSNSKKSNTLQSPQKQTQVSDVYVAAGLPTFNLTCKKI